MTPAPAAGDATRGMLLMLCATLCFALLDLQAKHLATRMSPVEVAWARYFGNVVLVALIFLPGRGLSLFRTRRPWLQLFRSLLLIFCTLVFFTAIAYMPLADAVALTFVAPLFVTALSVPLLGEKVGPRRWAAVAVGLAGALIIVRPGLGVMHWAAGLVLAMTFAYALYQICTRMLSGVDDPVTTLFYSALVGAVLLSLAVPFVWTTPATWADAAMLLGTGLCGGFGHYLLIRAYAYAEAAALAPLHYASLLWTTIGGLLVFGDFPDAWTFAGAAVLIGAGVYVFRRERALSREAVATRTA